jgi:sensor histidine kinase YesM
MIEQICYALVFLAEAFIAWLYYEYLFARRKNAGHIVSMFVAGYIFLFGVYQLDTMALNTLAFFAANIILARINYDCAVKTAILHSAFLSFIMTIAEVLIALLLSAFGNEFIEYTYNLSVMIAMAIMSKLLYLVFSLIGARAFTPHKRMNEEPKMMALFCSLPAISALLSVFIVYLGSYAELTPAAEVMMIVNISALLIVNLIFLVLYNYMQRSNEERLDLQLSLQKEEADAAYYQVLQEQMENQRILIHDIKNHLHSIDGLAREGRADEITNYISKLETTLGSAKRAKYSDDPILNLVLMRFAQECAEKQIDFQSDVRESCTSFMDAPSTTTLFGNLLSNAMEAAEGSLDRVIDLAVTRNPEQAIVVISVVNSCDQPPVPDEQGGFRTRKKNIALHGVGLKSINRIVRRYHGVSTMYYDSVNLRFHHVIQFPMQGT